MQQADQWIQRGKSFLVQLSGMIMAPPARVKQPVFYSGLGIEPTDFSEQLSKLQVSLRTVASERSSARPN
jgi:hypothetical protein